MNTAYKPLWGLLVILLAMIGLVTASKALQPREIIPWRTDFTGAQAEARQKGKPLFAYFTATWCGPCQGLKGTTWADTGVELALRDFVPVKIDVDEHPDLAAQYRIDRVGIPTFVVHGLTGEPTRSITGAMPPVEFRAWLVSGR